MDDFEEQANFYQEMQDLGYFAEEADSLPDLTQRCLMTNGMIGMATAAAATEEYRIYAGKLAVAGLLVGAAIGTGTCLYKPVRIMARHGKSRVESGLNQLIQFKFLTKPMG